LLPPPPRAGPPLPRPIYQRPIYELLWEEYRRIRTEEGELAAKRFLDEERAFIVWHGTRRKESPQYLRAYGFCSYTLEQADLWIDEATRRARELTVTITQKRVAYVKDMIRDPGRMLFSVTAIEEAVHGWADRNPEFIYDLLWVRLPETKWRRILRDMFGPPMKVTLLLNLPVRQVMGGPQDIHTGLHCFRPEEILDVEILPEMGPIYIKRHIMEI